MGFALKHLSSNSLEDIARGCFTVKSQKGGELIGLCPVHGEKNPSFSYNPDKDLCHCFSCGFAGDIIKLWMKVNGYGDEKEGFKAFCREFDISDGLGNGFRSGRSGSGSAGNSGSGEGSSAGEGSSYKNDSGVGSSGAGSSSGGSSSQGSTNKSSGGSRKKKQAPVLNSAYEKLGCLPDEWVNKLSRIRGWSAGAVEYLGIRQQDFYQAKKTGNILPIKKPERVAIPIYDTAGNVRNIRLYMPGGRKDKKHLKIISWGKDYGEARLFPARPRGAGSTATATGDDIVLLCEGEPDTICAISQGFNAITQTSKPKKWSNDQLAVFKDREVVIAFDADQPGQMYAKQYAAPALSKVAARIRVITWPDFMGRRDDGLWPEDHGQDLTDFFVKHKQTAADLQKLINDAADYTPPLPDLKSQALEFFGRGVNDRLSFKPRLLAEKILKTFQLLYCPDTALLYKYNGRYWEEFFEDHVRTIALKMLGDEARQAWINDAVFQVKSLTTIPHGRNLNDNPDYICVKNGMLNISTLDLQPHAPKYYASYELKVTFNPDTEKICERFILYLQQTVRTPEVIDQLQEFFGYCFLRQMPFAKCLLLLGPGADGKSKLLKVMREIIGPENCAAVSFNEMEDQFMRSSLYQKTLNISTEVGSKAIESPYFKAITSGDPVNAAFKHKNSFSFIPFCKLVFAANKMPRVLDNSDGFFRRILPVEFKRQFLEDDPDTDPFLEEKLLAEKSEIFHWALIGLQRLMKTKQFTSCDETADLLMDYKRLNNPVMCFVQDACRLETSGMAEKKELFKTYESYCRTNGYRAYSKENFFRELYAAFATLKTTRPRASRGQKRQRYIAGLTIRFVEEE